MNLKNIFTRSSFKGSDKEQRLFNGKLRPKYVEGILDKLKKDEIFVFGSNLDGYHGGGAAYLAFKKFGAIWGQGVGLQGHSYAIPTMQGGTETIKPYVDEFIAFAQKHTELYFYVTRIGCGIAGFTDADIAEQASKFTQESILQQVSTSLLAQANQAPSIALSLV